MSLLICWINRRVIFWLWHFCAYFI